MKRTALPAALSLWALLLSHPARAQERPAAPTLRERLAELEARVAELEAQSGGGRTAKEEVERNYSKGILTVGNLEFLLGGQLKIDFIDPQAERDPTFGETDSPDPHLEVERFRLIPRLETQRSPVLGQASIRAELDFHPEEGETILKEATIDHVVSPRWWLASNLKIGLDDRFIRPARLTQNYPLIGTAYWRDETVAIRWEGTIGDKRGRPPEETKASRKKARPKSDSKAKTAKTAKSAKTAKKAKKAPVEDDDSPAADRVGEDGRGEPVPDRSTLTRSTEHDPFDFASNPGAVKVHASVGNGFALDGKEIGKDNATFNEVLQDDRELDGPLSMREVGLGLGYERDFRELGEVELLGFYYDDELTDASVSVLQTELTERDPVTQVAIRGYGDSDSRKKNRLGFSAGYHFEAYHLYEALGQLDLMNPRRGDGLYLFYQWIQSEDGELDRDGWYAQVSWRVSNPAGWRFFRSLEPVARYGVIDVDQAHIPTLPLTWSRKQWLIGAILEVCRGIYIRGEYTWNDESTGAGSVRNNELLVQLLAEF